KSSITNVPALALSWSGASQIRGHVRREGQDSANVHFHLNDAMEAVPALRETLRIPLRPGKQANGFAAALSTSVQYDPVAE
ncbi:MAG: hypothetical protein ABL907_01770, partial [Hyphomicrobium sp.]